MKLPCYIPSPPTLEEESYYRVISALGRFIERRRPPSFSTSISGPHSSKDRTVPFMSAQGRSVERLLPFFHLWHPPLPVSCPISSCPFKHALSFHLHPSCRPPPRSRVGVVLSRRV